MVTRSLDIGATGMLAQQQNVDVISNNIAINGEGFFQIELPDGETAYTRQSVYQVNENGEIVTPQGFLLQPGITVPEDTLDIVVNTSAQRAYEMNSNVITTSDEMLQTITQLR